MDSGLTFNEIEGGLEVYVLGGDEQLSLLYREEEVVAASCWHSRISNKGLRRIAAIPNLREVSISVPFVTGDGIAVLRDCHYLRELHVRIDFAGDQSVRACANAVSQLNLLEELSFRADHISGLGVDQFANLINVRVLEMSGTNFADSDAPSVSMMPNITKISLSSCCITDIGLCHLSRASQLQYIDVSATQITNNGVLSLASISTLKELHVSHNPVTESAILAIAQTGELEKVSADYTYVGDGIAQLPRLCRNLRKLRLTGSRVSISAVVDMEREFPNLQITY